MRYWLTLIFLLLLGTAKSIGDLAGVAPISGLAAATNASPAMKVFTAHRGYETFSTGFAIEIVGADGKSQTVALTPELYRRLRGPYNRRNVYGAALSYGPVLVNDAHTAPLFDAVADYALCRNGGLLAEMGLTDAAPERVRLHYTPRQRNRDPKYPQHLDVNCGS